MNENQFSLCILEKYGPSLGRPYVDTLKGSKISNLKELRTRSKNGVFRILFVLDPERDIILQKITASIHCGGELCSDAVHLLAPSRQSRVSQTL
jgi:hypothetical protein